MTLPDSPKSSSVAENPRAARGAGFLEGPVPGIEAAARLSFWPNPPLKLSVTGLSETGRVEAAAGFPPVPSASPIPTFSSDPC